MNFQFCVERLFASEVFENFIKENKDAYPCGGFFVVDKTNPKNPDNKQHIDYYVPSTDKIYSFKLEDGVVIVPVEQKDSRVPEKIAMNYDFDFDKVEQKVEAEKILGGIDKKIQKLMFSMQHLEGKDYLVGTVFIDGLGMLRVHLELPDLNIVLFEKKSFFDFLKKG